MSVAISSVAGVSVAAATSVTVTGASTTVGTVLLVVIAKGGVSESLSTPTGWTKIATTTDPVAVGGVLTAYTHDVVAGDPTSYTFTSSSSDIRNYGLYQLTGASSSGIQVAIQAQSGFTQATPSLVPALLGMLPIAVFSLQRTNASHPETGLTTTGWSIDYQNVTGNGEYHASIGSHGPLTQDVTTAIAATNQWDTGGTSGGSALLILVPPPQPGTPTSTPASNAFEILGSGTDNAAQLVVNQANYNGPIRLVVDAAYTSIVSVSTTQTGTYDTQATANGPSATFWVQELSPGFFGLTAYCG